MKLAVHGAAGRMGQRVVALAAADPQIKIVAALESGSHRLLDSDAGVVAGLPPLGVPLSGSLATGAQMPDVVIDFSEPRAALEIVRVCRELKLRLVVATTGFEPAACDEIREAASEIPLLWAPSMSLTVNLAMRLSAIAAAALKDDSSGVDVEIIERHHRFKADAPSGTALRFGQLIAAEMGHSSEVHGRSGRPGQRPRGEIGYHAVRVGDNPGEHTILFGLLGETLELTVKASNRDCYAHGALAAARWLLDKPIGLYDMNDVLGL